MRAMRRPPHIGCGVPVQASMAWGKSDVRHRPGLRAGETSGSGKREMSQLSPEDGRAIDAILMNGHTNAALPTPVGDGNLIARISAAAKVLNLLDAMPAEEPPTGLADRTIDRVMGSPAGPRAERSDFREQPGY